MKVLKIKCRTPPCKSERGKKVIIFFCIIMFSINAQPLKAKVFVINLNIFIKESKIISKKSSGETCLLFLPQHNTAQQTFFI